MILCLVTLSRQLRSSCPSPKFERQVRSSQYTFQQHWGLNQTPYVPCSRYSTNHNRDWYDDRYWSKILFSANHILHMYQGHKINRPFLNSWIWFLHVFLHDDRHLFKFFLSTILTWFEGQGHIVTLANYFPRLNLFWTNKVQTPMIDSHVSLRVSDVTDKLNRWLAYIEFDWRDVVETAVECNNQQVSLELFLLLILQELHQNFTKNWNNEKQSINTRWISFFWHSSKYECNVIWVQCKEKVTPYGRRLLCARPIAFILWWMPEK